MGRKRKIELIGGPMDGRSVHVPPSHFVDVFWWPQAWYACVGFEIGGEKNLLVADSIGKPSAHNDAGAPVGRTGARYSVVWDDRKAIYMSRREVNGRTEKT